jgi:hypothetical protein
LIGWKPSSSDLETILEMIAGMSVAIAERYSGMRTSLGTGLFHPIVGPDRGTPGRPGLAGVLVIALPSSSGRLPANKRQDAGVALIRLMMEPTARLIVSHMYVTPLPAKRGGSDEMDFGRFDWRRYAGADRRTV